MSRSDVTKRCIRRLRGIARVRVIFGHVTYFEIYKVVYPLYIVRPGTTTSLYNGTSNSRIK